MTRDLSYQSNNGRYVQYRLPSPDQGSCGRLGEQSGQVLAMGCNAYGTAPGTYFIFLTGQGWKSNDLSAEKDKDDDSTGAAEGSASPSDDGRSQSPRDQVFIISVFIRSLFLKR